MNSDIQTQWCSKTYEYAAAVNAFVERGLRDGWENAGDEPEDTGLEQFASAVIDAVREANRLGSIENIKDSWPPSYNPLIPLIKENGQSIPTICLLEDNSIVARIGAIYQSGRVVQISGDRVEEIPNVQYFGRCPHRRFFAIAKSDGVSVTDGWQGKEVNFFSWPTGREGIPDGYDILPLTAPPTPTQLIPFPDGNSVLLVSEEGIFVLSADSAQRLLPTKEVMQEYFAWLQKKYPDNDLRYRLSMEHGAISPDGKLIAIGSQDSNHYVFDDRLTLIGEIGPHSEYPHYAIFSSNGDTIAFNSCHFYNGVTIGVSTSLFPGLKTEPYEENELTPILENGSRVYAGICRNDEFIIGDAIGYVRAFSKDGKTRWRHFIGSNINNIDISSDGKTLIVSTYAGFISIIKLDAGRQQPYQIGNGNHLELRRWIFWKNEQNPLIW